MARKNRVSVYNGIYHVTTRIAHRAMLLEPEKVKEKLLERIFSVADFSGVEVWGYTIMDNHLHLIVHVPAVPKDLWLDPDAEPAAYAFGMRPTSCRVPLWNGDSPSSETRPLPGDSPSRPPVGFMLDDEAMLARLSCLYGGKRAGEIARRWAGMREHGLGSLVDGQKERYCRRMYNLSHYLKTLKESISIWYNEAFSHEGSLWQGRFYSGVVENAHEVLAIVAAYVAYNPVKAGIADSPAAWAWGSYGLAVNDLGARGARCRRQYERMFGRSWDEVREMLESIYADELPPGVTSEQIRAWYDDYDEEAKDADGNAVCAPPVYRASQAIRVSLKVFRSGAYISADFSFLQKVASALPKRFPRAGSRAIRRCRAFVWELPGRLAA